MAESELIRLYAIVEGRVQGVGFRYFVEEWAVSLGVTGWVRNRWEGTVEVMAEADRSVLDKLLVALKRGPGAAYVCNIQEEWQPATGEFRDFRVRMTSG